MKIQSRHLAGYASSIQCASQVHPANRILLGAAPRIRASVWQTPAETIYVNALMTTQKGSGTNGVQETDLLNQVGSPESQPQNPTHLLLMVNGLFGSMENWAVTQRNLKNLDKHSDLLMLASNANLRMQTFEGINRCGERLAHEVEDCIAKHPTLERISVMGHSMGGLIVRYAICALFVTGGREVEDGMIYRLHQLYGCNCRGILFNPETGLIGGLRPAHFITLATPHLGCGGEGPAQVPFFGWTADMPLIGSYALKTLQYWANPFASTVLKRTGEQFFLLDGTSSQAPLLVRMTEDGPDGHFFAALRAFQSRTCYANSSGDHLVGWANSSLRRPEELPYLGTLQDLKDAKGVVREDPVEAALSLDSSSSANLQHGSENRANQWGNQGVEQRVDNGNPQQSSRMSSEIESAEATMESSAAALLILSRLQKLPWARVDTSFAGTSFPWFSHNLIQVTREWLNWEGEAVVQHLARRFDALETYVQGAG